MATGMVSNTSRMISVQPAKLSLDRSNRSCYYSRTSSCMNRYDRRYSLVNGVKPVSALVKVNAVY